MNITNDKMVNKDLSTNSRILISKLLLNPDISSYMFELEKYRPEVFIHSINVAYLTAEVCYAILNEQEDLKKCHEERDRFLLSREYDENFVEDTVIGALLHDIGKLEISNKILLKESRLDDNEFNIIKQHPILGYNMVKNQDFSDLTKQIILSHHEKEDGSGYPYGIDHTKISKGTQIVTVCDIYDAVTEKRAYRNGKDAYNAFRILSEEKINDIAFLLLATCPDR